MPNAPRSLRNTKPSTSTTGSKLAARAPPMMQYSSSGPWPLNSLRNARANPIPNGMKMKMLKIVSAVLGITASTGGCGIVANNVVTIAAP